MVTCVPARLFCATLLAVAALLAGACGGDDGDDTTASADMLTIGLTDPEASPPLDESWRLQCGPPSGTLPEAATACERLSALEDPWSPVPPDAACTQLYGGAHVLTVRGTFGGEPVDARFTRINGCEIERFDRIAEALGIGALVT
jgi:hypothetical protein